MFGGKPEIERFREDAKRELKRKGHTMMVRSDLVGYVSIAAPVTDWSDEVRFTLTLFAWHPNRSVVCERATAI